MTITSNLIEAHVFRIVNAELEFLLLKRSEEEIYGGLWQMVTGLIEVGETAYRAAIREIKEETGLTPKKFWVVPNINSFYSPEQDEILIIPVFAALVAEDIDVIISDEHSEYLWVNKEDAIKMLAWPGQHKSVETIYSYFRDKQCYLHFLEISL